ncbi:response regulator transcription factor [Kribbella catacumbae]|uniref:response regulator transcription factor n=1 Tax=Kribbella catacumbae TaxID=460086 RepID=UPI00035EAE27|nr:response regulator [Kribbella catacumbae]
MARILVVEDEPRIAALVAKAVRRAGHSVVVAEDGEVGLFLAAEDDADLVILDLGLPARSGIDVLSALSMTRPFLPVVILTGQDEPQCRSICLAGGAAAFVVKPFSVAALCDLVGNVLSDRIAVR